MLSCRLRNPEFNQNWVLVSCFGLISFLLDFFPSPSGFKKEGRKGGEMIKTKAALAFEGCILYSKLNNVARGQLIITKRSLSQFTQSFPVH